VCFIRVIYDLLRERAFPKLERDTHYA